MARRKVIATLSADEHRDALLAAEADGLDLEAWIRRLVKLAVGAWKTHQDVRGLIQPVETRK